MHVCRQMSAACAAYGVTRMQNDSNQTGYILKTAARRGSAGYAITCPSNCIKMQKPRRYKALSVPVHVSGHNAAVRWRRACK